MKSDNIIYYLFQKYPNIFFELIGEPGETANCYQFSSVAIAQTKTQIDGVFLPKQDRGRGAQLCVPTDGRSHSIENSSKNPDEIKQPVKTDSIFYRVFQEFPDIFFELIDSPPETAGNYQFSSVELKQTAFRIDGVFQPTQADENPIYFVEVQFQPDPELYSRFFAEIFLYLRQQQPQNNWSGVIIYPSRSIDTGETRHYQELFDSQRVRRIYLNELGEVNSLGISTIRLVTLSETRAIEQARILINRTRQEITDELQQRDFLQLIETILFYKLPTLSREELEAMFGLSELRQTRIYQEALEEGREEGREEGEREGRLRAKLETVPRLLAFGLTVEQIAEALDLSVEEVRQAAQNQTSE
jgi:predicted transposase/invertase (TIGR01784 family)